jgi:hypothetical protein
VPGFVRRFGSFPGAEVLAQIEGVAIIDLPPPGAIEGVGVGVACLVGEFPDVSFGVDISATGVVTTKGHPVELFSTQDMLEKVGGFDKSIGKFGSDMGNGFVELRNKKFSRLVVVPINLASAHGYRVFRKLPGATSATNATPVVPVVGAVVEAGREFKRASTGARVNNAQRVVFDDEVAFTSGVDGSTVAAAPAGTQVFSSPGSNFATVARPDGTVGVKKGDILVLDVIGANANADTYRVFADASSGSPTDLTVERMNGTGFAFLTLAARPWRIHRGAVADSGPINSIGEAAGYRVPARPLDATIPVDIDLVPSVTPPALTATTADPLSGLAARTDPTTGLAFDANVQAPNAANHASIDALYDLAIDSLLTEELPARDVNILWAARKSNTIRSKLKSHVLASSGVGRGRTAIASPELDELLLATVTGDAAPGVGANRAERVDYSWPGVLTFVPEASGISIGTADGMTTEDGILDVSGDGWLAAVLSNLAPERNPGQARDPVATVLAPILGIQRGVSDLGINEYILLRQRGICGLRIDRRVGPIFQSGVTTSLTSGEKNINRRRFADFIQDSLAERLVFYSKLPVTNALRDEVQAEHEAFGDELLSENNPAAQRIRAFQIDVKSGNTPALEKRGIFVVISRWEMIPTADVIVAQTEIGLGVLNVEAA